MIYLYKTLELKTSSPQKILFPAETIFSKVETAILAFSKTTAEIWQKLLKLTTPDPDLKQTTEILLKKGNTFNVELSKGITLKGVRVEYITQTLVLFELRNGEFKTVNPAEIESIQRG